MFRKLYKNYKLFRILLHIPIGIFRVVIIFSNILFSKFFLKSNTIKIVFVGPIHSPHFVNFLLKVEQHFANENIKIFQINSDPNYLKHDFSFSKIIFDGSIYTLLGYTLNSKDWQKNLFMSGINRIGYFSNKFIKLTVNFFNPDIFWIHDLQSGGYISEEIIEVYKKKKPNVTICASVFGNDLYFFKDLPYHSQKLKNILKNIDFLHIESEREKNIAQNLGFNGVFFPVSNVTMTDIGKFRRLEQEKKIEVKDIFLVIKGSYFLRSNLLSILNEIDNDFTFWIKKKIYIVNASDEDVFHLTKIKNKWNLDIDYTNTLSHKDFTSLLSRSKYFLTLNQSDGIPNAAAEATYLDCVPVFSNHTGLSNSLNKCLADLIVYKFASVNFSKLFSKLLELNDTEVDLLLHSLKSIFENQLYNDAIQRSILDDVFKHAQRVK